MPKTSDEIDLEAEVQRVDKANNTLMERIGTLEAQLAALRPLASRCLAHEGAATERCVCCEAVQVADLTQQLAALRKAAEPIAGAASEYDTVEDAFLIGPRSGITAGHLRALAEEVPHA